MRFTRLLFGASLLTASSLAFTQVSPTTVVKNGVDLELRSDSRIMADEINSNGGVLLPDGGDPVDSSAPLSQIQFRGANVQANDPNLDSVQQFVGFRSFVHSIQSETSLAAFGRNIVATYNTGAGAHLTPANGGLIFDRLQFSGFSTSNDGGQTFQSGFFPGPEGIPFSFGDPSIDVDRNGNFYFAQLGQTRTGNGAITVNKSTDGGKTWQNAVVAAIDDDDDKEWIAIGPDPAHKGNDVVYVTWTSFQATGSQIWLTKSTDGGATWSQKLVYAPPADPDPTHPQNSVTFSNPVVDRFTGTLYIPFAHFSNADSDFLQMLISDDGGETFRFAHFNVSGAPDSTLLPLVQPGELISCGTNNLRLTVHAGANVGGGQFGLRRFVNATRLIIQPAVAARNGSVYLAYNSSTSPFFGDPNGTSNILFVRSDDGGNTWTKPLVVNPPGDQHHIHPSLSLGNDPVSVHISYYTQHANETMDLDMANSHDRGNSFPADRVVRVSSTSFNLPPTNIPIPSRTAPFNTTNYDRTVTQCYALGEYQSVNAANGAVYALWGDSRNKIMQPVNSLDPISGQTHPQVDVFFQIVKAQ